MQIKKILTAAFVATTLLGAGTAAANAEPLRGYGYHDRDRDDWRARRYVDRRVAFDTLRDRHIRFEGDPVFVRGHYVVRSFDRFGRVSFVEINPYTGAFVGFIRL